MGAPLFPEVVVNGERVPRSVIAAEAQNHPAPEGKPGIAWRKAASAVAMRTLLLQEARRRGVVPQPVEIAPGRFETDEEASIRALLDATVEVAPPSEAEIRAEWSRDPARFRAPPLWEVSHILCACDPRDAAAAGCARARAADLIALVLVEPTDFARIATDYSDCDSRAAGGALGQIRPGDAVPEFEAALYEMDAGEIRPDLLLTRHGWHIIRMDARAEGATLPFESARERIGAAMEKSAWAHAARSFVEELVACAMIEGAELRASELLTPPATVQPGRRLRSGRVR